MVKHPAALQAAVASFPPDGALRLQERKHATPFKPPSGSTNPRLAWLRSNFPQVFRLDRTSRFADERREFSETYAGTTLYDATIEVFDPYRVDAYTQHLASSVRRPGGATFTFRPGSIPSEEIEEKNVIEFKNPKGEFVDVMQLQTQNWLSAITRVATLTNRLFGRPVLDSGIVVMRSPQSRAVTHLVAREVFDVLPPFAGIRYSSRIGQGPENWAIFERANPEWRVLHSADPKDPAMVRALQDLGLVIEP